MKITPIRGHLLLLTAALAVPAWLSAQSGRAVSREPELEAATLLQGVDSTPFIHPSRVKAVVRLLASARARFPELADIPAGPDRTQMEVHVADSVFPRLPARPRDAGDGGGFVPLTTTHIAELDSLNDKFGAKDVRAFYIGEDLWGFYVAYRKWPNIPVLAEAYSRVPQVEYASSPIYAGDGSFIRLIVKEGRDLLIFARGGGDCPAGCTEWDYYYVTHDTRTDRLTKESQLLHTDTLRGSPHRVFLWDFPTRHSFMPYPTGDSLLASTKGSQWWIRQHALDALLYMLGPNTGPWRGAGEQEPARFRELQSALRRPWKTATRSLIDALDDPDPDLRGLVRAGMKSLYQNDFGDGATAQRRWQMWLAHQPD
jgi:hypothetical protein